MAYLKAARAWREVGATLWLMLLGAGLLATSPPEDGGGGSNRLWAGPGPGVTLSDAEPRRSFAVTVLAPKGAEHVGRIPELAWFSLSASADHTGSSATDGAPGAAGAAGAGAPPDGGAPPWITLTVRDATDATVIASTPFLATWGGSSELAFAGDCEAADPAGPDPCRLSFTVEVERSPTGTAAESEVAWTMDLSASLWGAEAGADQGWTAEIEPL